MSWQPPSPGYGSPPGDETPSGNQPPPGDQTPPAGQTPPGYPSPPGYPGGYPGPGYPGPGYPGGIPPYPGTPGGHPYADRPLGQYAFPGAPGPAPGLVYAGFWWRVLGYLLDGLIVGVPSGILFVILLWPTLSSYFNTISTYVNTQCVNGTCTGSLPSIAWPASAAAVYAVVAAVIGLFYYGVLVSAWGSTVGQRAIGARVVRIEDPAHYLPLERSLPRSIVFWGSSLLAFVPGVGSLVGLLVLLALLWVAWDKRKQGLHDKLGRALVVRRTPIIAVAPYGAPYPYPAPGPTGYPPNPYLPPPQGPPAG